MTFGFTAEPQTFCKKCKTCHKTGPETFLKSWSRGREEKHSSYTQLAAEQIQCTSALNYSLPQESQLSQKAFPMKVVLTGLKPRAFHTSTQQLSQITSYFSLLIPWVHGTRF